MEFKQNTLHGLIAKDISIFLLLTSYWLLSLFKLGWYLVHIYIMHEYYLQFHTRRRRLEAWMTISKVHCSCIALVLNSVQYHYKAIIAIVAIINIAWKTAFVYILVFCTILFLFFVVLESKKHGNMCSLL